MVAYRNTRPGKVDDTNRRYGKTGQREAVQLEADRKWWNIGPLLPRALHRLHPGFLVRAGGHSVG